MAVEPTPPPKAPRVRPVPAVSRSIAILRLLGESQAGLGVKAIADQLGLVPSTCLHILRVLVSEDLVRIDPATKRYTLAAGMISLARSVLESGSFAQRVQPGLDRLAARHGVTAMGVEVTQHQSVVVLALSKSSQPFRLHTDVGSQFSSLVSATGRLIAAEMQATVAQLKKVYAAIAWDDAPSFAIWRNEVELARREGWALDRDHFVRGLTVVALPVFNARRQLTHTVVAVGMTSLLDAPALQRLVQDMRTEVDALGERP
ncbi:MAG: IclR family transcriptional regulator [Comamonas sp.]